MQTSQEKAFAMLRQIRDAYLSDMDSEVMKYIALGQPVPNDIATYLQELRDIPQTVTPSLLEDGTLDETTFIWPVPPLWWWIKKGFDDREIVE
jgi:hypothetical protein